jgi:shikimate kinase
MEKEKAVALSHSAITVVSAFASGNGVTVGIDLECKVTAELVPRSNGGPRIDDLSVVPDPHKLVETCAYETLRSLHAKIPPDETLCITVDSQIPPAIGLKSSSAVSVATVKAVADLFSRNSKTVKDQDILKISCLASIASGASLTGAFDDAAAGFLGGLVFSNNLKFRLLEHQDPDPDLGSIVKIRLPNRQKQTSTLKLPEYHRYSRQAEEAIDFAKKGIIVQAMLLNSIIHSLIHKYSLQPIATAISEGASASGISGKGPAIAAICPNRKIGSRVEKMWLEDDPYQRVISTTITQAQKAD